MPRMAPAVMTNGPAKGCIFIALEENMNAVHRCLRGKKGDLQERPNVQCIACTPKEECETGTQFIINRAAGQKSGKCT